MLRSNFQFAPSTPSPTVERPPALASKVPLIEPPKSLDLDTIASNAEKAYLNLVTELDAITKHNFQLAAQVEQQRADNSFMCQFAFASNEKVVQCAQLLKDMTHELAAYEDSVCQFRREHETFKNETALVARTAASREAAMGQIREENTVLRKKFDSMQDALNQAVSDATAAKAQLQSAINNKDQEIFTLQQQLRNIQQERDDSKQQNEQHLEAQALLVQQHKQQILETQQRYQSEQEQAQAELNKFQRVKEQQVEEMNQKLITTKRELQERDAELSRVKEENERLNNLTSELSSKASEMKSAIKAAEEEANAQQKAMQDLEAGFATKEKQLEESARDAHNARERAEHFLKVMQTEHANESNKERAEASKMKQELQKANEMLNTTVKELSEVKQTMSTHEDGNKKLVKKIDNQTKKIDGLTKELERKRNELASQANEIARQASEIERQANEIESKNNEIERQANDIESKANEIERQANEIESKANEIERQAKKFESQAKKLETTQKDAALEKAPSMKQKPDVDSYHNNMTQQQPPPHRVMSMPQKAQDSEASRKSTSKPNKPQDMIKANAFIKKRDRPLHKKSNKSAEESSVQNLKANLKKQKFHSKKPVSNKLKDQHNEAEQIDEDEFNGPSSSK